MRAFPPTIIIVHPKERRSKCTAEPLRGREGFAFSTFPAPVEQPLDNYVQLGIGGPPLSSHDADRGLLVLDGTWRLAGRMQREYAHVPVRTLPDLVSAYPRASKLFDDPSGGLATIEAVYAAYRVLARPTDSLLDGYRWAEEFVALNRDRWHVSAPARK
jgi:pre-rRNA-processing protein TSR3